MPPALPRRRRLAVYLVKPSKYDDEGYVIRYWRGVLPSNTLACLSGLTDDVRKRQALGPDLEWRVELIDESVQRVDVRGILRAGRRPGTTVVVCLVGVQSNQFARAADLAQAFRAGGAHVVIGGFHVSGALAMLPEAPPEIRALWDAGVTVVAGEIEGRWESILRDVLEDRRRPLYNFLAEPPDLQAAPLPSITARYLRRFVATNFTTLDCGRGCPFACSFCTVINVQGRVMRFRGVDRVLAAIRDNYRRYGVSSYFFTDDNFCRHRRWEALLDGLIRLRKQESVQLTFMIQADTQSVKLPRFVEKAKAAGCSQVFIGLESLNPANLSVTGKRQNRVEEFRGVIEAYRQAGINTHVAYIIGFPFDDPASVRRDLRRLMDELGPEQASFFMLTPLPGSQDHLALLRQGAAMDADLNRYDSFHATTPHPRMTRAEWTQAYEEAWAGFYSLDNMTRILRRARPENYWAVFANFIWYKNAMEVEGGHPMLHGFVRMRTRAERRPGLPPITWWQHAARLAQGYARYAVRWPRLALQMEEVWLQTRPRSLWEQRVVEELRRIPKSLAGWRRMRVSDVRQAYRRAAAALRPRHAGRLLPAIPPRALVWLQRRNPFAQSLTWSRASLHRFWRRCAARFRQGQLHRIHVEDVVFNGLQELALFAVFASHFFTRLCRRLFARRLGGLSA